MALYIRDDKVRELPARVAELQGVTVTEAVRSALLDAQRRLDEDRAARDAAAQEVIRSPRAVRKDPVAEEVLYDGFGQPAL